MKLSIIIPVYNEEKFIEQIIDRVKEVNLSISKEIIVVDDKSTDNTREILEKIKNKIDKIVYHDKNMGKGMGIKTGLKYVTGDIVIIQDADLEYDPKEYQKLIDPIINENKNVVYGSRFKAHNKKIGSIANFWANKFLTKLINIRLDQNLTDMETCYKAFKVDVIKDIDIYENRFGFEPEITAKVCKKGIQIYEVPITYNPRTKSEGKKINLKDGLNAILCIYKYSK